MSLTRFGVAQVPKHCTRNASTDASPYVCMAFVLGPRHPKNIALVSDSRMAGAIKGSLCSGRRENTRELVGENERGPSTREKKACGRNRALREQACRRPTSERERDRKPQLTRPHRCHGSCRLPTPPPPPTTTAKPCGCVLFPPHEQLPPIVKFREEQTPTSRSHL